MDRRTNSRERAAEERSAPSERGQTASLTVRAQSGYGIYPIEGALVTVYSEDGKESSVVSQSLTDESGSTPRIFLQVYEENDRQDYLPGGRLFTVEVTKDGYQSVVYRNVQLYPLIETLLNVNMSALPDVPGMTVTPYDGEVIL